MTEEQEKSPIYSLTFEEVKEIHKDDTALQALDGLHRLSLAPNYVKPNSVQEKFRRLLRDKVEAELQIGDTNKKILDIIKEYQVDIWLLHNADYENYIRIRKACLVISEINTETGKVVDDDIPENLFNYLQSVL